MCGIAGILNPGRRYSPDQLSRLCVGMRDTMVHRGPDDAGVWVDPAGRCALGHRRLSIIDMSAAGHQPMIGRDGAGVLTFNGEIYNFQALRRELEEAGERFQSHSDTEVLLAGLRRHGAAFVKRLDGMYAFAYWDADSRGLLLARDPFGEKPLYLYRTPGLVAFASELSAFETLPGFDDVIERETLAAYCCLQYVPAPKAIYRAASKLPPGAVIQIDAAGETAEVHRFAFRTSPEAVSSRPLGQWADELDEILVETIRTRLISDAPLGAFLSGGVDSSTVVAIAAKRLNRSLDTFSIGFSGAADSEHEEARAVSQWLGTRHIDAICDPDIADAAVEIGGMLDEPNGDSSCMPTLMLSRLTRRTVKAALSGDGGDEMFGGYGRYFATLGDEARFQAGEQPYPVWRPDLAYYSSRVFTFTERDIAILFGGMPPGLDALVGSLRQGLLCDPRPLGNCLRELDARDYLPGAVLAKVDRMSMRQSLEVRAPLLGLRVAEFAARLPADACFGIGQGKLVLKEVARRYLPEDWLARPKKGFGIPMRGWGDRHLLERARALLRPGENRLAAWVGQANIDAFLADQDRAPMTYRIWAVVVLESWLRRHPGRPD